MAEIKNLQDLLDSLADLPENVEDAAAEAIEDSLAKVQSDAQNNINYISGELADSIKVRVYHNGTNVRGTVNTDVYYARMVEYGHARRGTVITGKDDKKWKYLKRLTKSQSKHYSGETVPPHPFLRPAWDAHKGETVSEINTAIQGAVEEVGGHG